MDGAWEGRAESKSRERSPGQARPGKTSNSHCLLRKPRDHPSHNIPVTSEYTQDTRVKSYIHLPSICLSICLVIRSSVHLPLSFHTLLQVTLISSLVIFTVDIFALRSLQQLAKPTLMPTPQQGPAGLSGGQESGQQL